MNDSQFKKGIENLKNISLSQSEKQKMLSNLTTYADFHAPATLQKKSVEFWSWSFFQTHSAYAFRAVTLLIIVTGTSYAAENALPGELLYPFKVNVNEPVRGALLTSTEEKAQWESDKFIRRVEEAEALANEGKLDDASLREVEKRIDGHFEKYERFSGSSNNAPAAFTASDVSVESSDNSADNARMAPAQAKVAAPAQESVMMFMQVSPEAANMIFEDDKDEFEKKIDSHRSILEKIRSEDTKNQSDRIRRLEIKLDEKTLIRSQNKKNSQFLNSTSTDDSRKDKKDEKDEDKQDDD